jgi:type II secretory pathway component PulC
MSDGERRLRIIAIGFAGAAMLVAITAAIVVMKRGGDSPAPVAKEPEKPAIAPIIDKTVLATDVIRLQRNSVEAVVESGQTLGVRVKDEELSRALGFEPGDILTALSGRSVTRDTDLYDAIFNVSMMSGTTMYAEITRGGTPTLLRWKLDGDLREARYGASGSTLGGVFGSGTYTPPPLPPPDPMLDTIEKVDDTHVKLPRKTAQHIFDNPMANMKGARVVPAIKNGQPNGLKLYAIRPSSVFARLGFTNGDTIQEINGTEITSADKALELYTSLSKTDEVKVTITRRGNPMQLTITITK